MSKERWAKKKDLKRKEIKRSFFYAIAHVPPNPLLFR